MRRFLSATALFALLLLLSQGTVASVYIPFSHKEETDRFILLFDHAPYRTEIQRVRALGARIHHQFHLLPALSIELPPQAVESLSVLGVQIFPDQRVHVFLSDSVPQIGADTVQGLGVD
ncbi:hypothetical protein COU77_03890, partial [Candidatus Peregrinibacteria bacterium CG10_big_fil_rev_8_21_14_0_10_49_16]